jgi:hypothetical protein
MYRFLGSSQVVDSKVSTKVRCYHISFLSKYKDQYVLLYIHLDRLKNPNEYVIRHTCGCRDCCNPDHLVLGTKIDNEYDKGAHEYLQRVFTNSPEDYESIVNLFNKNKVNVL